MDKQKLPLPARVILALSAFVAGVIVGLWAAYICIIWYIERG